MKYSNNRIVDEIKQRKAQKNKQRLMEGFQIGLQIGDKVGSLLKSSASPSLIDDANTIISHNEMVAMDKINVSQMNTNSDGDLITKTYLNHKTKKSSKTIDPTNATNAPTIYSPKFKNEYYADGDKLLNNTVLGLNHPQLLYHNIVNSDTTGKYAEYKSMIDANKPTSQFLYTTLNNNYEYLNNQFGTNEEIDITIPPVKFNSNFGYADFNEAKEQRKNYKPSASNKIKNQIDLINRTHSSSSAYDIQRFISTMGNLYAMENMEAGDDAKERFFDTNPNSVKSIDTRYKDVNAYFAKPLKQQVPFKNRDPQKSGSQYMKEELAAKNSTINNFDEVVENAEALKDYINSRRYEAFNMLNNDEQMFLRDLNNNSGKRTDWDDYFGGHR